MLSRNLRAKGATGVGFLVSAFLLVLGCDAESGPQDVTLGTASEYRQVSGRNTKRLDDAESNSGGAATRALRDSGQEFTPAKSGYAWSFPEDHWAHPGYKTEWWYFTGHLDAPDSGEPLFSYQVTFFRVGLAPAPADYASDWSSDAMVMAHVALSDHRTKRHRFTEALYRVNPALAGFGQPPDPILVWSKAPPGTAGRWELAWTGRGFRMRVRDDRESFALELTAEPGKELIFQGPGGLSRKGEDASQASLYYSFTRLETKGTVSVDGEEFDVVGESWMDKEFGSSMLSSRQVGWDWFSLQFDDGAEVMLYMLRAPDGGVDHASGTSVDADGTVDYFSAERWALEVQRRWNSPEGGRYPVEWRLELGGRDLNIVASFDDQENRGTRVPGLRYWEGAVEVRDASTGKKVGRGFVEMTGYGS